MGRKYTLQGKKPKDAGIEVVGALVAQDLEELNSPAPGPQQALSKVRDAHHSLARYVALGLKDVQIAAMTGYTQPYISTIKNDPAFKELVTFYRNHEGEEFADMQERIRLMTADTLQEIRGRLEGDDVASIPMSTLVELAKVGLDRSGYGAVQKHQHLHATLSASEIEEMKNAAKEKERVTTVEAVGARAKTDRLIEGSVVGDPGAVSATEEPEGTPSAGNHLREEDRAEASEESPAAEASDRTLDSVQRLEGGGVRPAGFLQSGQEEPTDN
jgi:hypothetical protein